MVAWPYGALPVCICHIDPGLLLYMENLKGHYARPRARIFDGKGPVQNEGQPKGVFTYSKALYPGLLIYYR